MNFICLALKLFHLILNSLCLVIFLYQFPFPIFMLRNSSSFCNLDYLKTSGMHLYTLSISFEHFDYDFFLFGIKGLLCNS